MTFLGDAPRDYVCDCKPTYIFDPQTSKCFQIYSQGKEVRSLFFYLISALLSLKKCDFFRSV